MDNITHEQKVSLLNHLMQFVTEERKNRFTEIIKHRTRHICIVMEDIYQPHNASAVLRTCDLTGIQDIHIIENRNKYAVNPEVALGSSKWLTLKTYNNKENNTASAIAELKKEGYKIVATTPHINSYNLDNLPIDNKIAVMMGTELTGLTDEAIKSADYHLQIPMYGFTESYNISVSAALVMFTLVQRLRKSDMDYKLSEDEYTDILLEWARNSVSRSDVLINKFLKLQ